MKALLYLLVLFATCATRACCYPCKSKDKKLIEAAATDDLERVNQLLDKAYSVETLEKAYAAACQNNRRRASISIGHVLNVARMVTNQAQTPQAQQMRPQANTI